MQQPRATWADQKKFQKVYLLWKNTGKYNLPLHRLIEKFSLFYFKHVRLPRIAAFWPTVISTK